MDNNQSSRRKSEHETKATEFQGIRNDIAKGYSDAKLSESKCASVPVDQRSDFQRILDCIDEEASRRNSLIERIERAANSLKPISYLEQETELDRKQPSGVVDSIWYQFDKIKNSNSALLIIAEHLEGVIG